MGLDQLHRPLLMSAVPLGLAHVVQQRAEVEARARIRPRAFSIQALPRSRKPPGRRGVAARVSLPVPSGQNRDRAPSPRASCAAWRSSEFRRRAAVPRATRSTAIPAHSSATGTPRLASLRSARILSCHTCRAASLLKMPASTAVAQSTSKSCTSPSRSWRCFRSFPHAWCSCGRKFSTM